MHLSPSEGKRRGFACTCLHAAGIAVCVITYKKKAYLQLVRTGSRGAERLADPSLKTPGINLDSRVGSALNFYILLLMQTKLGALKIDAAT